MELKIYNTLISRVCCSGCLEYTDSANDYQDEIEQLLRDNDDINLADYAEGNNGYSVEGKIKCINLGTERYRARSLFGGACCQETTEDMT